MRNKELHILLTVLLAISALFITPTEALAVVKNLNGQTGDTQTFQNDSNITISSSSNTHSLGWQGLLPLSRGGTGASSFTAGSLLFSNGTSISQNNSKLFWDDTNNRLGIGISSPTTALDVLGNAKISGSLNVTGNITSTNLVPYTGATGDVNLGGFGLITPLVKTANATIPTALAITSGSATSGNNQGADLTLQSGFGFGFGHGGNFLFTAGDGGDTGGSGGGFGFSAGQGIGNGNGGDIGLSAGAAGTGTGGGGSIAIRTGDGGDTSGHGGSLTFIAGNAVGSVSGNGGNIGFKPGSSINGILGTIRFSNPVSDFQAIFDTSLLTTSDQTFTFPNVSGTFGLLEVNQTWNGLNKFEASTNSTIYVGSSVKSGCIALGDSDGSGVTYVTANDGALTASATKPSVCQ